MTIWGSEKRRNAMAMEVGEDGRMTFSKERHAWIACCFALMRKVRLEGLMSIEADVEFPREQGSVFARFPQVLKGAELELVRDVLRMMVGGNLNPEEMEEYARMAGEGMAAGALGAKGDMANWRSAWAFLRASMQGYAPQVAADFARQSLTVDKPEFETMEECLREVGRRMAAGGGSVKGGADGGAIERAKAFMLSIGAEGG